MFLKPVKRGIYRGPHQLIIFFVYLSPNYQIKLVNIDARVHRYRINITEYDGIAQLRTRGQ